MSEDIVKQLETIVENEPFVLFDTGPLVSTEGYGKGDFLKEIYDCKTITIIPVPLLERKLAELQSILPIICAPSAHITAEVFKEYERGARIEQQALEAKKRHSQRFGGGEYASDETISQINEETFRTLKLLKRKTLNFRNKEAYQILLEFFKTLSQTADSITIREIKKHWKADLKGNKHAPLYGDESIDAAVFYYMLTENSDRPSVAVVTTDHDIKRNIRTAYLLFAAVTPKLFAEKADKTPCKVYLPDGDGTEMAYKALVDTTKPQTIGTLSNLSAIIGCDKVNDALELAYDTFNRLC